MSAQNRTRSGRIRNRPATLAEAKDWEASELEYGNDHCLQRLLPLGCRVAMAAAGNADLTPLKFWCCTTPTTATVKSG